MYAAKKETFFQSDSRVPRTKQPFRNLMKQDLFGLKHQHLCKHPKFKIHSISLDWISNKTKHTQNRQDILKIT